MHIRYIMYIQILKQSLKNHTLYLRSHVMTNSGNVRLPHPGKSEI